MSDKVGNFGSQASGVLTVTPADGKPYQLDTLSCKHCQFTWVPRPGSGVRRGFCTNCMGPLCGRPSCVARGCVPAEQLLENIESGRPLEHRRIITNVSAEPPRG